MKLAHKIIENIAEEMVRQNVITADQLAVARVSRENLGEDLGQILLKKGFVKESQLLNFIAQSLSVSYVSLDGVIIPKELIQKIPAHLAKRYHLIPVREENEAVVVAMADPLDLFALDDIRAALKTEVMPVLASSKEIDQLITQHYHTQRTDLDKTHEQVELMNLMSEESETSDRLQKIATGPMVIQTVNHIVAQAYHDKASDIHIEPMSHGVRIRYRIDGLLEESQNLPKEMLLPIVSRIKIMSGLDIAERRIPQDGRVRIRIGGNALDLRISSYPTLYGEKVVMRLLNKEQGVSIDSLGFVERDRKTFTDLIMKSHGIFLVTGPTGSGKSTTLYAALTRINTPEKNIISIEDPIESEIIGVNQAQINMKSGVTFAAALRSILRQDPDIIMLGEIRDGETSEIAVRAAITGHLVLSTLHTNTAAGAISRLVDLGVQPFLIASSLIGVLAQRLVRKICGICRVEIEPDREKMPEFADQLQRAFKGQGCPACRMTGYSGRMGIFELAPITEVIRKLVSERATDQMVEDELRRQGVKSMMEDGIVKINEGITTVDEVFRVTQED